MSIYQGNNSRLEGTNLYNFTDIDGKKIFQDFLKIIDSNGEGFSEYYFPKPSKKNKELEFKKFSYIKYFEPFNWIIGTGEYQDVIDKYIQNEVNQYVTMHRFGPDLNDYVFVIKLLDINGGDQFGIMYANGNRADLVGKYLSDRDTGARGEPFIKDYLEKIREKGEGLLLSRSYQSDTTA